jgi:phosphoribosyl-ATP pyrophosphohydrolase/phosphoribosyl-AMP cyclohydrolase
VTLALALDLAALRFDERGLLPVVVQDETSGAVLMLAWADAEALRRTVESGEAWFWSRSRERLWRKGETSGNVLTVVSGVADCDGDAVLLRVRPAGPACHRGTRSCFEPNPAALELGWLAEVIAARRDSDPAASWSARLLGDPALAARKVGEEAVETMVAALGGEGGDRLAEEAADLVYHLLALLAGQGVAPAAVAERLAARRRPAASGGGPE